MRLREKAGVLCDDVIFFFYFLKGYFNTRKMQQKRI